MDTLEILTRLVAFDTTSRNSNLEMIGWIEDYLSAEGIASTRVLDGSGTKSSLVARIGPEAPDGVVLCGHTDTVPVDGQPWTVAPFALSLSDDGGRAYGRGTTDMKGFIAACLAAVPTLKSTNLRRPAIVAFSYDEEVGCLGAPGLADHLTAHLPPVSAVIIGEPTSMEVVRAHKGMRVLRTTVTGLDAHSSRTDQAASAIMAAARLVTELEDTADRLAATGAHDQMFTPPYTTVSVGLIDGGQAMNIVPRNCTFVWEYRSVPGEDVDGIQHQFERFAAEEVLPRLRKLAPEAAIATEVLSAIPSLDQAGNETVSHWLGDLGMRESVEALAYATDGAALQKAGLPVAVCGPGSMRQGHKPDEYVELTELQACDALVARVGESLRV